MVRAPKGIRFKGGLADVTAVWTGVRLERAGDVSFSGGVDGRAAVLTQIQV